MSRLHRYDAPTSTIIRAHSTRYQSRLHRNEERTGPVGGAGWAGVRRAVPRGTRGFRLGCGTDDVYYTLALRIERALLLAAALVGLGLDLAKAFDSLPQTIMLELCAELGMSERILRPLRTMYRRLHRRFRFAGNVA